MKPKNKKINILYCIEYLGAGGTEKQLIALMHGLDKERFAPHLCCLRSTIIGECRKDEALRYFNEMPFSKIQLDINSFKDFRSIIELLRLTSFIRKNKIDIIQTYFQDPTVFGAIAGRLCGKRNIIACFRDMGFWRGQENETKMRFAYSLCNGYVANSLVVRDLFANAFKLSLAKWSVIYNGIDAEKYPYADHKAVLPDQKVTIGILANFNRRVKRIDVFLRMAALISKKCDLARFIIAGDGEFKAEYMDLAFELGIRDKVDFCGRVEDVPQFLQSLDIGAITSDSEGFSNAILEYMAAGIPVIATAVGGNCELIQHGINGYLAPAGAFQELGDHALQLINNTPLYAQIRQKAQAFIRDTYSISTMINHYQSLYTARMHNKIPKEKP